jgi:hypothetical protein
LSWGPKAGPGTMRNREAALRLTGEYAADWTNYSSQAEGPGGRFRYLAMEIRRRPPDPTTGAAI